MQESGHLHQLPGGFAVKPLRCLSLWPGQPYGSTTVFGTFVLPSLLKVSLQVTKLELFPGRREGEFSLSFRTALSQPLPKTWTHFCLVSTSQPFQGPSRLQKLVSHLTLHPSHPT